MKFNILKSFLILCFLAFQIHSLSASEQIGRIVKIRGVVKIKSKAGKIKVLKNGDHIVEGDTILSQSKSFAKILMKDDTLFQLGPKSKFSFEKFKMQTKSKRQATYNLIQGKLRSLFTVKSKSRSLIIKTPTAAMGIRGTEIVSDVYRYKGKIQTDIALISGKLEITTLAKKKFFLGTGHMVELRKSARGNVNMNKRKLPTRMFNNLKKGNKGGSVFLLDERKSSGEIKVKEIKLIEPIAKDNTKSDSNANKLIIKDQSIHVKSNNSDVSVDLNKVQIKNRKMQKRSIKQSGVSINNDVIDLSMKKIISNRIKIKRKKIRARESLKNLDSSRVKRAIETTTINDSTIGTRTNSDNYTIGNEVDPNK